MKHALLLLALIATQAHAQIIYTDVDPDANYSGTNDSCYLDLDNNGQADFLIIRREDPGYCSSCLIGTHYRVLIYPMATNVISGFTWLSEQFPQCHQSGQVIGANLSYSGTNGLMRDASPGGGCNQMNCVPWPPFSWAIPPEGYLGLRFDIAGATHYGWARLSIPSATGFTLKDYAYNSVPDAEIIAGYTYPGLDAAIQSIGGIDPNYCAAAAISPTVVFKNNGNTTITTLQYSYDLDGGTVTNGTWSGTLATGQTATLTLGPIDVTNGAHVFHASCSQPNGGADENLLNNMATRNFTVVDPSYPVTLNITTDDNGSQTTWDVATPDNVIVRSGGPYANWTNGTVMTSDFCLLSGCYVLTIHDASGDGICCAQGNGSFELLGSGGTVLVYGNGNFGTSASNYFCVGPDHNDASIKNIFGIDPSYCGAAVIDPTVVFKNYGTTVITTLDYSYDLDGGPATTGTWSGTMGMGNSATLHVGPIPVPNGAHVFHVSCSAPNGGADENLLNDTGSRNFTVADPSTTVTLNITTDDYGSETTWDVATLDSTIAYSGGPYTDGTGGTVMTSDLCLGPGCYILTVHDAYGDGICCEWGTGDFELLGTGGTVLVNGNGNFGTSTSNNFCISPNGIDEAGLEQGLRVFPDPSDGRCTVILPTGRSQAQLVVRDAMGREVFSTIAVSGSNTSLDLHNLATGAYNLEVRVGEFRSVRKLHIVR